MGLRLVSQDRLTSIPYENICLAIIHRDYPVEAYLFIAYDDVGEMHGGLKMASYSDKDRALKVMEMIDQTYSGRFCLSNVDYSRDEWSRVWSNFTDPMVVTVKGSDASVSQLQNMVFRFPKDEDVKA